MNTIKNQTKKGFTIIEVVLVLAIAGLIFLMVFLALPALQRSQRNTQRRSDASRLLAAVNDYKSANRGRIPQDINQLRDTITRYVGGGRVNPQAANSALNNPFNDPTTNAEYTPQHLTGAQNGAVATGTIQLVIRARCGDNGAAAAGNSPVVRIGIEDNLVYCVE